MQRAANWMKHTDWKRQRLAQAAESVRQYQNMTVHYAQDTQGLTYEIDLFIEGAAFLLRAEKTPVSEDAEIKSIGDMVIIYPKSPKGHIQWEESS